MAYIPGCGDIVWITFNPQALFNEVVAKLGTLIRQKPLTD